MRRSATALIVSLCLSASLSGSSAGSSNVPAATGETVLPGVVPTQIPETGPEAGQPPARAGRSMRTSAVGETVWVFIDSLETHTSPNNEGGWTHYDDSAKPTAWHIDTFLGCQNHSWWCGMVDSSWTFDSNRAGYDNDWTQYLQNSFPSSSVPSGNTATLSFRHHFDAEPLYDFGYVEVNDLTNNWTQLAFFTGKVPNSSLCDTFSVIIPDSIISKWRAGNDGTGTNPLPVPFRFTFVSDVGFSSADGLYNGDGWIIDNISVKTGQTVLFSDNVENGMGNWTRSTFPGVGDFFYLQSNVLTEDVCSANQSKVWTDWNQATLSLVPRLNNFVVTPPVATNRAGAVFLNFDIYRNLPLNSCFYYHTNFRTKNVGDAQWGNWIDPTFFVYYGGNKDWIRQAISLPGAGGKDSVQVELGLRDYADIFCGGSSSPSNTYGLFDNVAIGVIGQTGPGFVVRDIDLFNDTFQTTPFFKDDNFNTPIGDTTVVQVSASHGYKNGFMFYRLNGGSFNSVPLQHVAPALPTHFFADVPPGSYPANTKLEYYFAATDSQNVTAYFPVDAITNQNYRSAAILPLKTAINLPMGCSDSLASILFVNHFSGREPQPYIASALTALGFKYDTWDVNGPSSGVGNCLGGSDPADVQYHWPVTDVGKLLQYTTIIWHSGDLSSFTITPQDQAVIQSWIQQPGKNRNFWISGDDVGFDLMANQGANNYNGFLGFTCGVLYLRNNWENTPQDTLHPVVKGVPGGPAAGRFMHLNGDCPIINQFDLVTLSSAANQGKSGNLLTYPNSFAAATRYATDYNTFSPTDSAKSVFLGFSFNAIEEGGERIQLANQIVHNYFKENACYVASGVEEGSGEEAPTFRSSLGQNMPNPFNPETAIHYSVAHAGQVDIRIYNVSGALVRTLVNHVQPPGEYVARWNGADDQGHQLPSGAYFYVLDTKGFRASKKLILLR
jgi:hypothetical protein